MRTTKRELHEVPNTEIIKNPGLLDTPQDPSHCQKKRRKNLFPVDWRKYLLKSSPIAPYIYCIHVTYDIEPLYYQIKAEIIDAKTKKSPKTWHSQCRVKVATQRAKISLESHFERTRSELKKNSAQSGKDSWHIFCISFSRFFAHLVGRLLHCSPHHFNLSYLLKFWQSVYIYGRRGQDDSPHVSIYQSCVSLADLHPIKELCARGSWVFQTLNIL